MYGFHNFWLYLNIHTHEQASKPVVRVCILITKWLCIYLFADISSEKVCTFNESIFIRNRFLNKSFGLSTLFIIHFIIITRLPQKLKFGCGRLNCLITLDGNIHIYIQVLCSQIILLLIFREKNPCFDVIYVNVCFCRSAEYSNFKYLFAC